MAKIKNIDDYIALQPEKFQEALEKIRGVFNKTFPKAEEVISYGMPAFKYHGMLGGFAGFKDHMSFFPWTNKTVELFKKELKGFKTSKGTIQFTLEKPIPVGLLKKMLKARAKDLLEKEKGEKKKTGTSRLVKKA